MSAVWLLRDADGVIVGASAEALPGSGMEDPMWARRNPVRNAWDLGNIPIRELLVPLLTCARKETEMPHGYTLTRTLVPVLDDAMVERAARSLAHQMAIDPANVDDWGPIWCEFDEMFVPHHITTTLDQARAILRAALTPPTTRASAEDVTT